MIDAPASPFRRGGTRLPAPFGAGFVWIVRLQPPATGESWVVELLAVLRRWLEAARLPWANVVYDDRSYLFRVSSDVAPFEHAAASIRGPSTLVAN